MNVLKQMDHPGIVKLFDSGMNGTVVKPSGQRVNNLVYLLMEHVSNGTLFSLCEKNGEMGENAGRFFLRQMLDVVKYMHDRNIVHRDIKLENILLTENLQIKLADFGFARK